VQRTFSSFPSGWAGAALLVLRLAVGASATFEAGVTIARNHGPLHMATIAAASVAITGVALIIGFLTPIASLFLCLTGAVITGIIPPAALVLFNSTMAAFEFAVMSAALVILGPGAISVDARLFGRREVAIPRASRPNDY
jgi:uncharacterized membrane protein YphA (DoxX/SURF4 family)